MSEPTQEDVLRQTQAALQEAEDLITHLRQRAAALHDALLNASQRLAEQQQPDQGE